MPKLVPTAIKEECRRLRVEERLSGPAIRHRTGASYFTVYQAVKDCPLTDAELHVSRASNIAAARNKLKEMRSYVGGDDWTPAQSLRLKRMWSFEPKQAIKIAFPRRSWGALMKQAEKLGLRRYIRTRTPKFVDPALKKLSEIRVARRITQQDLADLMGYHVLTIRKWETGAMRPTWLAFRAWLDALDCDVDIVPK